MMSQYVGMKEDKGEKLTMRRRGFAKLEPHSHCRSSVNWGCGRGGGEIDPPVVLYVL